MAVLAELNAGGLGEGRDEVPLGTVTSSMPTPASGAIAARPGITPGEELGWLRARAFSTDCSVLDVARSILAGDLGVD